MRLVVTFLLLREGIQIARPHLNTEYCFPDRTNMWH